MSLSRADVEVISCETQFQGYFRIDRYVLRHRLHDGSMSGEMSREIFERGHAVVVLPVDPKRGEVVLIEQFRPGAYAAGWDPWLVEIVAGIRGENETPDEVARRECLEETGLEIERLIPIYRYLVSPGGSSESVHLYCAIVDSSKAGGVFGLAHEHEDIRVMAKPIDQALGDLHQGRILNAMTIIGLQWLELNREKL
jgi:ADP-ribose pyrophosphatase